MITQYFDINQRLVIQAPGTLAPATLLPWVYGDNYDLAIYLVGNGDYQAIGPNDSLLVMLFQPGATLPEQNLAIISAPIVKTDPAGFNYYEINVNLKTTQLAALVQANNTPAQCEFHYIFTPTDGERFSSSADLPVTVNPDPSQSAAGSTPVPPGYPTNPNIFEQIANKNLANGYAGLDPNTHLNPNQIPTDTTLAVTGGKLSVIGGGGGTGNPYVAVITNSFAVPAEAANTPTLTLAAAAPDLIAGATVLITDGTLFITGSIASISGTALTVTNNGLPGAVAGTIGANAHLYLGSSSGPVDTTRRGLPQKLPSTNPAKQFYRGDDSFAQANFPDLSNLPATFPPATHGTQHLPSGNDPVPLATSGASGLAGLCPSPDGTTISVTGGKLTAIIPAGTQPFVATTASSFVLAAIGPANTFTVTLNAAWPDILANIGLVITDGTHVGNLVVTNVAGAGLTLTCYNIGGGSAPGTSIGAGAHVYIESSTALPAIHGTSHLVGGADPIALASPSAAGLCPAIDNTTIQIVANVLKAVLATLSAPGIVQPDGTTLNLSGGKLAAILATATAPGIVQPDGSTITISGGKISVSGASIMGIARAKIYSLSGQSIPTGSAYATLITLGSVSFDTAGFTTPNANALTFVTAGLYEISWNISYVAQATATGSRAGLLIFNGNTAAFGPLITKAGISTAFNSLNDCLYGSMIRNCAAGDYVQLYTYQTFGSAISLSTPTQGANVERDCTQLWTYRIA